MRPILFLLAGTSFFLSSVPLPATIFTIADGDVAGLTTAINTANGNGQNDLIQLASSGTYTLTSALPQITADGGHGFIIHGNGSTIQRSFAAPGSFRIFTIAPNSDVTIVGLTMTNGGGSFHGGAIYNAFNPGAVSGATTRLTITNCTLDSNSGDYGGAIYNDGGVDAAGTAILVISNSTISNNFASANGGGIFSENGTTGGSTVLYIANCLFSGNSTNGSAGAVQHDGSSGSATGTIVASTFTQNSAKHYGGAINVDGSGGFEPGLNGSATLDVINCTFDQNKAVGSSAGWGGAVALDGSDGTGSTGNALVNVDSCTFSGNLSGQLGDALYVSETGSGTTVLKIGNTILASGDPDFNISTDNISGGTVSVISKGYNLSDDATCGVSPCGDPATTPGGLLNQPGDQRNTVPMLDPAGLQLNGGFVPTIALQATSPALDHGNSNTFFGVATDERGEPRPYDDAITTNSADGSDIGAYEADVRVTSSKVSGSDFQISFATILGYNYELQSRPNLGPGMWNTVTTSVPPPPIAGSGGIIQVTIPSAFAFSTAYYRLQQLP